MVRVGVGCGHGLRGGLGVRVGLGRDLIGLEIADGFRVGVKVEIRVGVRQVLGLSRSDLGSNSDADTKWDSATVSRYS